MRFRQFEWIEATFSPKRTDNLTARWAEKIGARIRVQAQYVQDEGEPYAGEWVFTGAPGENPPGWVPESDLTDIKPADAPDAKIRVYGPSQIWCAICGQLDAPCEHAGRKATR